MPGHRPARRAAERITSARPSLTEDVRRRQRRYLVAMVVRVACLIVGVACWSSLPLLALGTLVGGAVIPFVAVVVANGGRGDRTSAPAAVPPAGRDAQHPASAAVVHLPSAVRPARRAGRDGAGSGAPGLVVVPLVARVVRRDAPC